jgi:hypothetical protein
MLREPTELEEHETTIKAELLQSPHASGVGRESRGRWSYSTVWRVADHNDIVLTEGCKTIMAGIGGRRSKRRR